MIWYVLVGYVILSQIFVVGVLLFGLLNPACDGDKPLGNLNPVRRWVVIGITFVGGIVLAPAVAPFIVYLWRQCKKLIKAELAQMESIQRTHRDLMLEPLHPDNIDDELRSHFNEQTPAIVDSGYRVLGDVWLKGEPLNSKARIYLQHNGHTFVEVGRVMDVCYTELISFLDDGSVVSSANCEPLDIEKPLADNGYFVNACHDQSGVELLQAHEQFLSRTSAGKGVAIRRIPESQWKEYFRYHNRRFSEIKYLIGKADESCEAIFPQADSNQLVCEPVAPSY